MLSADALGVPPEGVKLACGGILADTKAAIGPSAGTPQEAGKRKSLRWDQM